MPVVEKKIKMSVVDVEQEIAPSLKLGDLLGFLNDPESGFHREIMASEVCLLFEFELGHIKIELFLLFFMTNLN